ncbi:MAG: glycosyltransferase family 87 protein [Candidatus Glassbacteria bacterium]
MASKKIFIVIAIIIIAYGIKSYHKEGDLAVFTRGADNLLSGTTIYRNEVGAFTYPPFFAFVMIPFTYMKTHTARIIWYTVNIVLIILILRSVRTLIDPLLNKAYTPPAWRLTSQAVLVIGSLLTLRFFLSTIDNQQSDLLVLSFSLLGISSLERNRSILCGAFLAVAISVKLTPLLFIPYLVYRRAHLSLLYVAAFTVIFFALPETLFPARSGIPLTESWYELVMTKVAPWEGGTPWAEGGGIWTATNILNQSLPATVYRYLVQEPTNIYGGQIWVNMADLGPGTVRMVVYLLAFLLLATSAFSISRIPKDGPRTAIDCGIIFCLMLLLSPQSSKPHFSSLILPNVCLLTGLSINIDRFLLITVILSFMLCTLSAEGFLGNRLSDVAEAYGAITLGTFLIWCALIRLLIQIPRAQNGNPLTSWSMAF